MITQRRFAIILSAWAAFAIGAKAAAQPESDADVYLGQPIPTAFPYESNHAEVKGSLMHYVDVGEGDPVLFLHGNPTWSYLWRNIIPYVEPHARCIAPDLIGMGKSDTPDDLDYRFFDHVTYLETFIEQLGLEDITLVVHDWGSGLGFHYARRHPDNVKAIAFMEAFVQPWLSYEAMGQQGAAMFKQMRTPDVGWQLVVEQNMFIEQILPAAAGRPLTDDEMDMYRLPFLREEDRKPVWMWPNEVPIAGEPADVAEAVEAYNAWLQQTNIPKLMFTVEPGFILNSDRAQWCRDNLNNLAWVHLGQGIHYIQEQYPHEIGTALAAWYQTLD